MFDGRLRIAIDPMLDRAALVFVNRGITPNQMTLIGFGIGMLAAIAIVYSYLWTGLILLLVSRLADGLDGSIARASNSTSDFGGFLDITLDFAFYGLIPLAFVLLDPVANGAAGGVLLLSFYVNGASFLAYAVMAEKRGLTDSPRGKKSLVYTTGLAEATETIAVFVAFCLFPLWFSWVAYAYAAVVFYTAFSRMMLARADF